MFIVSFVVCVPFTYHLFLGKTLIFRLWLHYTFLSRRTNLNSSYLFSRSCLLPCQPNHPRPHGCMLAVGLFARIFLLQLNPFPGWVHKRVLAQETAQRGKEWPRSQALLCCSATTDAIPALICFLFCTRDKLQKLHLHQEMGKNDNKLKMRRDMATTSREIQRSRI